jgi:hypothetical protein
MTVKQQNTLEKKVANWRKQPAAKRRAAWHAVLVTRVKNSMAMEKEPVSKRWIRY